MSAFDLKISPEIFIIIQVEYFQQQIQLFGWFFSQCEHILTNFQTIHLKSSLHITLRNHTIFYHTWHRLLFYSITFSLLMFYFHFFFVIFCHCYWFALPLIATYFSVNFNVFIILLTLILHNYVFYLTQLIWFSIIVYINYLLALFSYKEYCYSGLTVVVFIPCRQKRPIYICYRLHNILSSIQFVEHFFLYSVHWTFFYFFYSIHWTFFPLFNSLNFFFSFIQ